MCTQNSLARAGRLSGSRHLRKMSDHQLTIRLTEHRLQRQHNIKNTGFTELVQGSHYTNNKKTKGTISCGCVCELVAQSCLTFCNPTDCIARQASLSMRFSRQEYWRRLPFPSPGDLPDPGIEPKSPALQADSLLFELQRSSNKPWEGR